MIVRIEKREAPYVIIDRTGLQDARLSYRARGILAYLLSKPDKWVVRIDDLQKNGKEGREAIKTALKELSEFGYAELVTVRDDKGKMGGREWVIYEAPTDSPKTRFSVNRTDKPENRLSVFPTIGKPVDIDNKENIDNKEIDNKEFKKGKRKNLIEEGIENLADTQKTKYISRLKDDQRILEEIARRQKVKVEEVLTAAENFATDKILTDEWKYPHYKDFRNHFYNWQRYNSIAHENKSKGVQPGANRPAKKQPIDISTAGNWI